MEEKITQMSITREEEKRGIGSKPVNRFLEKPQIQKES